ncbi:MAG: cytochrome c peroxidase [Saprospiraceae bacterium]|jgi:cytochrome c peroxidase
MVPDSAVALTPRNLTPTERLELIDFLTNALNDDNMDRYAPDHLPSGLCFPNNDPLSRKDIGCE